MPDIPAIVVAKANIWATEDEKTLVPAGDKAAAVLVASRGTRLRPSTVAHFPNRDEFFITPEAYEAENPHEGAVAFLPLDLGPSHTPLAGHPVPQPPPAAEPVAPVLDETNSVVVKRDQSEIAAETAAAESGNGKRKK